MQCVVYYDIALYKNALNAILMCKMDYYHSRREVILIIVTMIVMIKVIVIVVFQRKKPTILANRMSNGQKLLAYNITLINTSSIKLAISAFRLCFSFAFDYLQTAAVKYLLFVE